MRSVAAERAEPMSSASPIPCATMRDPSMDQRSHQHFADLGVCLNEGVHLVACQLDDFARVTDAETHLRGAAEDHADVTGELSGTENGDQEVAQARRANDLDLTSLQHKERHVGLAAFDQYFAASDRDESLRGRQSARSAQTSASET